MILKLYALRQRTTQNIRSVALLRHFNIEQDQTNLRYT